MTSLQEIIAGAREQARKSDWAVHLSRQQMHEAEAFLDTLITEAYGAGRKAENERVLQLRKGMKREYGQDDKSNDYTDGYNNALYDFAKETRTPSTTEGGCCEKCARRGDSNYERYCDDVSCPCHQPTHAEGNGDRLNKENQAHNDRLNRENQDLNDRAEGDKGMRV